MSWSCRRSLIVLTALFLLCLSSFAFATTYYVDSVGGNDNNNGTSTGTAWRNLTKVNTITFAAGDQILLKCGSVWNGQQLWPKGSGSSGSPIVINSYSTGAKPLINGQAAFQEAVKLSNQQYWEINNLEVTNWAATAGIYQGVHILNTNAGTLNHIYLQSLDVHDVNGHMTSGTGQGKCNGGIVMEIAGTTTASKWNDIHIDGCNVHDLSRTAIRFQSTWGSACTNPTVVLSTNVVVRNCTVSNYTGDGICAFYADGALVEYNVSSGGCTNLDLANVPVWTWDNVNSTLQYNEVYGTVQTRDGMAFDFDGCSNSNVLQYNYSHSNNGGFLMIVSGPDCAANGQPYVRLPFCTNNIARYNISQGDKTRILRFAGKINTNYVYNNTMYLGPSTGKTVDSNACDISTPQNTYLYNNIIYNTQDANAVYTFVGSNYVWDYNHFYSYHPTGEPSDSHKLTTNPLLVNPGSGGTGRNTVDGYQLQAGSPARDSGRTISGNGGKDYWGHTVPSGSGPDRGAHEYQGGGSPPVANFTGNPTSGTAPLSVAFTDTSTNTPTSWSWSFGDSSISTSQNPSHTYNSAGSYTVSLRATNAAGYDDEVKSSYITVSSGGGSAPTFVAAGAVASNAAAITPALPAGIQANDILLLFLETYNQAISIANQNGGTWTQVASSPQGTTGTRLTAFWSRYNGTQGAPTTSDSGNHQLGRIVAIRGCATSGDPWDVTAGGVESTSDTSGSIPGATTTIANTLVVTAIATDLPDAAGTANCSAWTNANLTNLTERTDNTVTAGNGGGLAVATGVKATAGACGSTSVTLAAAATKGMMSIALKATGGGGGSANIYPNAWTTWMAMTVASGTLNDVQTSNNVRMVFNSAPDDKHQVEWRFDSAYAPAQLTKLRVEIEWNSSRTDTPDYWVLAYDYILADWVNIGTWSRSTTDTWFAWESTDVSRWMNANGEVGVTTCACPVNGNSYTTAFDTVRVVQTLP